MKNGAKLGRYEIRDLIGAGGMGEVFLARDLELDRPVALKVLPAEFCCNLERVQRFKQEARAASALNHPNIITIYEIGEADDRLFIATEYIKGDTVRQKIENNDLNIYEAVHIAEQVASALAVAHEARIIHRDIKPENVMIRADGYAKILDFGLAKPAPSQPLLSGTEDRTLQMIKTEAGMVMGSVSYMSPEQARGKEVDERTDIWSLGVVIYEMVTGKNPFAGETVSDSLAAVIHIQPKALKSFVEDIPEELEWIVEKTLQKKADDRYQNIKDLALDLKDLRYKFEHAGAAAAAHQARQFNAYQTRTTSVGRISTGENKTLIHHTAPAENLTSEQKAELNKTSVYTASRPTRTNWLLPLIVFGFAAALAFGAWYYQPFSSPQAVRRFENVQISRLTENGKSSVPALSPDGKYVAFVSNESGMWSLVVKQIATGSTVQIAPPSNLSFLPPAFTPDGNYIYYTQVDKGVGTLYQVPALGGNARRIIVDVDSKVSFSPDGKRIAFVRHNPEKGSSAVYLADAESGANPEMLIETHAIGEARFSEVAWTPNGEEILVISLNKTLGDDSSEGKILAVSILDKSVRQIGDRTWISPGSFSWQKEGSGFYFLAKANPQEPKQIWFHSYESGEARQITSDSSGYSMMSLSADGETIAASRVDVISSLWAFNPQNREMTQLVSENRMMQGAGGMSPLPDGRILFTKTEGNRINLWTMTEDARNEKVWTTEGNSNIHPSVSPDGKFVVYSSNSQDGWRIWKADIDGKNPVQLTKQSSSGDFRPQVLADNKTVVFERRLDHLMKGQLMKIAADGSSAETPLFADNQTNDVFPSVSDDGKRLAYITHYFDVKNLSFHSSVNVAQVKGDGTLDAPKEINAENVSWSYRWSQDGKTLTFLSMQGVPNILELSIDNGKTRPLTNFNSGVILNFEWVDGGKRLLIVRGIVNSDLILIKDNGKSA